MGFAGISPGSLILILLLAILLFGTKRVRSIGSDLAGAIKGFREGMEQNKEQDADHNI
jgi:sec-independent protein translocase protein TatA